MESALPTHAHASASPMGPSDVSLLWKLQALHRILAINMPLIMYKIYGD